MTCGRPYCFTNPAWYIITDEVAKLTPLGESIKEVKESYMEYLEDLGYEKE